MAISQYLVGLQESHRRNRNCLHEIATGAKRPRNDKLGSLTHSPEIPPDLQLPKAVTDRRYRRNWCMPF